MRPLIFLICTLLFLPGCVPRVFSPEALKLVDPGLSFAMIKDNPVKYVGRNVLIGGTIAGVKNSVQGGELEVVEFPVTEEGQPVDSAVSGGRFLAYGKGFLDPLIFKPGMMVSIVGEVTGKRTLPLDTIDYTYPVLDIKELYLWKPEQMYRTTPVFHFGLGVFHSF